MTSQLKTATLPGGLRLPYVEQGDPAGVPVVLLHGYSDSWRSYELLLERLPDFLHAYALTQRGHGDADRPATGYRPEDHADDLRAFLDAVGLDAAVVVGHSGGSYTAQRFAVDHPERTLALVLNGAYLALDSPDVDELLAAVDGLTDPVDPGFVRAFQESTLAEPVPAAFFERIVAESRKLPARVWRAYLREMTGAEVPSRAGTIAAPTLILWGGPGRLLPARRPGGARLGDPGRAPRHLRGRRPLPPLGAARPRSRRDRGLRRRSAARETGLTPPGCRLNGERWTHVRLWTCAPRPTFLVVSRNEHFASRCCRTETRGRERGTSWVGSARPRTHA
jgi:non-heme chloroperoxidase